MWMTWLPSHNTNIMKITIIFYLLSIFISHDALGQEINKLSTTIDSSEAELIQHLKILDEASKNSKEDTIYCCWGSITFLERKSYISAGTIGSIIGTFGFTKEALAHWHKWYEKKYEKKTTETNR